MSFFENTRKPVGLGGKIMVAMMNFGHSAMAAWGLHFLQPAPDAMVLDCGCGGGANIKTLLKRCPKGKVQGIDYSAVSVEKARKVNADAIAAGVDAKDGMVAIQGWEQVSTVTATDLCLKMKEYGVKHIIYTDISRDGMLSGPNIPATKKLTEETGLDIIASGGVSCMEDLQALYDAGISGAIMGKALYEKRVDLEEAVRRFEK